MKTIISTTYDDKYLFFLPLVTWAWNKLEVDVICFLPQFAETEKERQKYLLAVNAIPRDGNNLRTYMFDSPKHKEATYAQCSRLFAACLDLPEDEVLITSDVDMLPLNESYFKQKNADFDIFGSDLVPEKQVPICYISASVKDWRRAMDIGDETYQECLDDLLGEIEAQHFRGNYWGKDQETAYQRISSAPVTISHHFRAREGTQFASRRYDRDDQFILDRLSPDTIDFHLPRPGFEDNNFNIIMRILEYHYPNDSFQWLINYRNEYLKIL